MYQVFLINVGFNTVKIKVKPLKSFDTLSAATEYQVNKNAVLRFNQAPQRAIVVKAN